MAHNLFNYSWEDTILADIKDLHPTIAFYCKGVRPAIKKQYSLKSTIRSPVSAPERLAFSSPDGIAVHPETGFIFIADVGNARICILGPDGTFLNAITGNELARGKFSAPCALGFDRANNLVICDRNNHQVHVYAVPESKATWKLSFGEAGTDPKQLQSPWGVAFSREGNYIISDNQNARLQVFTPTGEWIKSITKEGGIASATGIVVDDNTGNIYVAGWGTQEIQAFDAEGNWLKAISPQASKSTSSMWGLTIDRNGTLVVVDDAEERVVFFSTTGQDLISFGRQSDDDRDHGLDSPLSCALDRDGNLWVTDDGSVHIFG